MDTPMGSTPLSTSQSFHVFPLIVRHGAQQLPPLANPRAPVWPASPVDTRDWVTDRPTGRSSRISNVSLRVPHEYIGTTWRGEVVDTPGERTLRMLGGWTVEQPGVRGPDKVLRSFHLWISPDEGYPTIGFPIECEQVELEEGQRPAGDHTLRLARYVVAGPNVHQGYLLAAYWDVSDGVWLTATAAGPDRRSQDEAQAIFESVRFSPQG